MYQPTPTGMPGFQTFAHHHAQKQGTEAPVSSSARHTADVEAQQQDHRQHGEQQARLKKGIAVAQHRLSGWQMLAVSLILVVAFGMIANFHLSVPAILSEQLHTKLSMQQQAANASDGLMRGNASLPVNNTPQMLFDDAAKIAIETSKRRYAAAMAEKESAQKTGVNLEWQRYHQLEGSVYVQ